MAAVFHGTPARLHGMKHPRMSEELARVPDLFSTASRYHARLKLPNVEGIGAVKERIRASRIQARAMNPVKALDAF